MVHEQSESKLDRPQPSSDALLRRAFALAHDQIRWVFLDLFWKVIWLSLTLAAFIFLGVWLGSELGSVEWTGTGSGAINTAIFIGVLRQVWSAYGTEVFRSSGILLFFSVSTWFALEAFFRARMVGARQRRPFGTFLVSNVLKCIFLSTAALTFATICFGRYFATPVSEWSRIWPDTRGPAVVAVVTLAGVGFILTVIDTLIRGDAVELLATDLFRVISLIGILLVFEATLAGSCAVLIGAGFLHVAGLESALAMLGATVAAIGLLNILHSYLLLVRYLAVGIMRHNVIEI